MTSEPAGLSVDLRVRRGGFVVEAAFDVSAGETVALLGPNGAGKSTVVEAVAGAIRPESGRIRAGVRVLQDDRTYVPPEDRAIGIAFQDGILFPHMDAADNVAFPLRSKGMSAKAARERAIRSLREVAPAVQPDSAIDALSGGERQRVSIARAIIGEPVALVMDEPLSAIDAAARPGLRSLIRRTVSGFAGPCLLVTHDPVDAMTLSERMVILEHGKVTQTGTPAQVLSAPRTPYAAELVGVNLFRGRLERLPDGAGRLVTDDGEVTVGWPAGTVDAIAGSEVLAILSPSVVSLHPSRPEGSARNVFEGVVGEVSSYGGRARVRLATSPPLVAEITAGSLERLGLRAGSVAWASFKAVEVRVLPG
jgi:molybdate transport system ATP-binding protein